MYNTLLLLLLTSFHFCHCGYLGEVVDDIGGARLGSIIPVHLSDEFENRGYVKIRVSTIADAKYYTNLAGASYCEDEGVKRFNCKPYCQATLEGTQDTPPTSSVIVRGVYRDLLSGVKGYLAVVSERKEIVLSFAGERPQSNKLFIYPSVLLPLNVNQPGNNNTNIRTNAISVHALMHSIAFRLYTQYRKALTELLEEYSDYKLLITGHSIGGSIASLTAVVVRQEVGVEWNQMRVFTYGQMRMGNKEFAKWINQQDFEITRVVNFNDKSVLFIFRTLNYQHFGNELFIEKDGSSTYCDNKYLEDPTCTKINFDFVLREAHVQAWNTQFGIDC
ncbi:alpha/beta-hydrolase [Neoconidiobolus thromboides FSU 785]|nr:alpha/beta-hydrolase [Neoconidiobolus thromboides FSU 785]